MNKVTVPSVELKPERRARPTVFDIVTHYEPQAHYHFSRRLRNEFDVLAKKYYRSTWMLGSYGGKAHMQTDIRGIGVASCIEVGRLAMRLGKLPELLENVFELFLEAQTRELASGDIARIQVSFSKAVERSWERDCVAGAFSRVFGMDCSFMSHSENQLELGQCVAYQTIVQYLRENGLYHSAHRNRIETVQRHLHQEVGRYENHKFYVRPTAVDNGVPLLQFCYTGEAPDSMVEAFMIGYTDEKPEFVPLEGYRSERGRYVTLDDYERASRRYGGLWVLQQDLVRYLFPQQVGVVYLFCDADGWPEEDRWFSWEELLANAHEFICTMPEGYRSAIGTSGYRLSGGATAAHCYRSSFDS